MDPTAIINRFGEQGIVFFLMALVIAYLFYDNRNIKKEYKDFRDSSQAKHEGLMEKVITLTSSCANQLESFNKTITAMTDTVRIWREEFLKGRKE